MKSTRLLRVERLLQETLSEIVQSEVKDPRLGFWTITGVEVSPDLRRANVYLSIMGDESDKKTSLLVLKRAAPVLRRLLNERLRLKHSPRLHFVLDESSERYFRIEGILARLRNEEEDRKAD